MQVSVKVAFLPKTDKKLGGWGGEVSGGRPAQQLNKGLAHVYDSPALNQT